METSTTEGHASTRSTMKSPAGHAATTESTTVRHATTRSTMKSTTGHAATTESTMRSTTVGHDEHDG